jgi:hypothetical protein
MAIKIQGDTVIYDNKVFKLGSGTTAQRPGSPETGMIWYNTQEQTFEGYSEGAWDSIGGSSGNYIPTSVTTASSITPNLQDFNMYIVTALDQTLTINAPTGSTFTDGTRLLFRIRGDGTPRTLQWAASYVDYTSSLPVSTAASYIYVGCLYNAGNSVWDVIAVAEE